MRKVIAIIIPIFFSLSAFAQQTFYFNLADMFPLNDFRIEESTNGTNKLQIVALNANEEQNQKIEGKYEFVINGFIEKLIFKDGIAPIPEDMASTILYIKHESVSNNLQHLYYYVAGMVIPIPFWLLLLIPILILLLALLLKRMILLLLIIGFVLFFVLQGLDLSAFLNLIKESIQNVF